MTTQDTDLVQARSNEISEAVQQQRGRKMTTQDTDLVQGALHLFCNRLESSLPLRNYTQFYEDSRIKQVTSWERHKVWLEFVGKLSDLLSDAERVSRLVMELLTEIQGVINQHEIKNKAHRKKLETIMDFYINNLCGVHRTSMEAYWMDAEMPDEARQEHHEREKLEKVREFEDRWKHVNLEFREEQKAKLEGKLDHAQKEIEDRNGRSIISEMKSIQCAPTPSSSHKAPDVRMTYAPAWSSFSPKQGLSSVAKTSKNSSYSLESRKWDAVNGKNGIEDSNHNPTALKKPVKSSLKRSNPQNYSGEMISLSSDSDKGQNNRANQSTTSIGSSGPLGFAFILGKLPNHETSTTTTRTTDISDQLRQTVKTEAAEFDEEHSSESTTTCPKILESYSLTSNPNASTDDRNASSVLEESTLKGGLLSIDMTSVKMEEVAGEAAEMPNELQSPLPSTSGTKNVRGDGSKRKPEVKNKRLKGIITAGSSREMASSSLRRRSSRVSTSASLGRWRFQKSKESTAGCKYSSLEASQQKTVEQLQLTRYQTRKQKRNIHQGQQP